MIGSIDFCVGALLFTVWLFSNAYVMLDVCKHGSEQAAVRAGQLPRCVAGIVDTDSVSESVKEDLDLFARRAKGAKGLSLGSHRLS